MTHQLNKEPKNMAQTAKTNRKSILFIVLLVLVVVGGVVGISTASYLIRTAPYREKRDYVMANGVETTAISNGKYDRSRSPGDGTRLSHSQYFAYYVYKTPDGQTHTIQGRIGYNIRDDIKEGKKATVRYAQNGDTFQDILINEQYHFTNDTNAKFRTF